jgi:4-hydroxy-3-polyprenylbenzoate decarboxylase
MHHKIVIAVTGASGSIYAKLLIEKLNLIKNQFAEASVVFSSNAKDVWKHEIGDHSYQDIAFKTFQPMDFNAPFASGSARYNIMIVVPCSMGTMGRIAAGISNDLITRAADVILKERRKLILITRDMPLNLIHINNMKTITEAGGIICPACPSFYSKPDNIQQLASTVVDRALDLAGFQLNSFRWNDQ